MTDTGNSYWGDSIRRYQLPRAYLRNTDILRTRFQFPHGRLEVTDFMPVGRKPGVAADDPLNTHPTFGDQHDKAV